MAGGELGAWDPMSPGGAAVEFGHWGSPWWVAGGWAIDLLVGRQTRPHGDLDILILRRDHVGVRQELAAWDLWAADPPGSLRPWPVGEALPAEVHDVWCRRHPGAPWSVQLMIDDTDGDEWIYRRDQTIRRSIRSLTGRASSPDLRVLAPEVQLLHKSGGARAKDDADFEVARHLLSPEERTWLRSALQATSPEHPWISQL